MDEREIAPGRVLTIIEGDITQVAADTIVNAANNAFAHGGGVDGAIRAAAGPELSGEMRRNYPAGTPTGSAVATGAYALPARWVIHAVGPVWGRQSPEDRDCPRQSAYSAVTTVWMPPRMLKSPTTFIFRGRTAATRSSRIRLVTAS